MCRSAEGEESASYRWNLRHLRSFVTEADLTSTKLFCQSLTDYDLRAFCLNATAAGMEIATYGVQNSFITLFDLTYGKFDTLTTN